MNEDRLIDILVNPQTGDNHKDFMKAIGLLELAHNNGHIHLSIQTIMAFEKVRELYNERAFIVGLSHKELDERKCYLQETMMDVGIRMLNLYKDELLAFHGVDAEAVKTKGPNAVKYTDAEISCGH
jgi:hypothetical protein